MSYELFDLGLGAIALGGCALAAWAWLDRRSAAHRIIEGASGMFGGPWPLALVFVSALAFAAVSEDVLSGETDEWILQLDRSVQHVGHEAGRQPVLHALARGMSAGTGIGLVVIVATAATAMMLSQQPAAAAVLTGGTLGAWALYAALKVIFRVPRPSENLLEDSARGYGFPSGHTVVTVVALGLLAWTLGSGLGPRGRGLLYGAAALVALLTGASRVLLHAHWVSDVIAGGALGILYVALLVAWLRRGGGSPLPHGGG